MTTYTTKIAKNGAINFYNAETGKRVKEADAVMDAIENGGTFFTACVHGYDVDHVVSKEFMSPITAYKWICRMARKSTTYADGDAQIIVGFNGAVIWTQTYETNQIQNDELRAYVANEDAPIIAEELNAERESQIRLQMQNHNITREQAEELVDYLRANREHYNSEVAANVKAMLANFAKVNEDDEPAIVETANVEEPAVEVKDETVTAEVVEANVETATVEEPAEPKATLKISTKENADGKITAYYIDGKKVRKAEVEYHACNPAYDGIIEIDYFTAKYNFPNLYNSGLAVVFKNWVDGSDVMTKSAANKLGLKLGKRISFDPAIYRVEDEAEIATANTVEEPVSLTPAQNLAAEIVNNLGNVVVKFAYAGEGKNGGLALHYETFNSPNDEFSTDTAIVEVFTPESKYILDHVNVIKGYGDDKQIVKYLFKDYYTAAPTPAPVKVTLPSELPPLETEKITVATVQDARNIISQRFSGKFTPGEVCECWDGTSTAVSFNGNTRLEVFSVDGNPVMFDVKTVGDVRPFLHIDIDNTVAEPHDDVEKVTAVAYCTCTSESGKTTTWIKDKGFDTTTAAAEWIIAFAQNTTPWATDDTRVVDFAEIIDRRNGYDRYVTTDADINALYPPALPTAPKPGSPCAIANGLTDILQNTTRGIDCMDVTTQSGVKIVTNFGAAYIEPDWNSDTGYVVFSNRYDDALARYETPEQVIDVMTALRDAIKAGKTEFTFPAENVEPPKPPVEPEPVDERATLEATLAECQADERAKWQAVCEACDNYDAKKKAVDDALHDDTYDGDGYTALEDELSDAESRMATTYEIWAAANNAMCDAERDLEEYGRNVEHLGDSLTRAMKIALEYYKGFCRAGKLTAAENELKLYNICRKATLELLKE